jgi:hypothetical protein
MAMLNLDRRRPVGLQHRPPSGRPYRSCGSQCRRSNSYWMKWPLSQYVGGMATRTMIAPGPGPGYRSSSEAAPLNRQDAMVRILGGILGYGDTEGTALFHALEDEINPVGAALLHAA